MSSKLEETVVARGLDSPFRVPPAARIPEVVGLVYDDHVAKLGNALEAFREVSLFAPRSVWLKTARSLKSALHRRRHRREVASRRRWGSQTPLPGRLRCKQYDTLALMQGSAAR